MTHRYFVPQLPAAGGIVDLPPNEASHANRVMRVKPGDEMTLFDGKNGESRAIVVGQSKRDCQCDSEPVRTVNREPNTAVSIAIALPRGDRTKFLIERLTELGVHTITPLHAQRSQGKPNRTILDKLLRIAIESCKQSGRNQLPRIEETVATTEYFCEDSHDRKWIAHPAEPEASCRVAARADDTRTLRIAIGPEGGFTQQELVLAKEHGYQSINLGPRIYRVETAAIVTATLAIYGSSAAMQG